MSWIVLALAGAAGAVARALLVRAWGSRGTLLVNLAGAFALGVAVGLPALGEGALKGMSVGFLGAFTTFSGWMLEANERWRLGSCTPGPLGRAMCSRVLLEIAAVLALGVLAYTLGGVLARG